MKTKQTIINFKYLFILLLVIIIQILIVGCDTENEKTETTTSTEGIINQEKELDNNIVNIIEEAKQKKGKDTIQETSNETTEDNTTTKKREKVIIETIEPEIVEIEIIEPKEVEKKNKEELVFDKYNIKTKIAKKENAECNIIIDVPQYKTGIEADRNTLNEQLNNTADEIIEELITILDTIEVNESEDYIDYPNNILLKKPKINDKKNQIVINYDIKVSFPETDREIPLSIEVIYDKNEKKSKYNIISFKF